LSGNHLALFLTKVANEFIQINYSAQIALKMERYKDIKNQSVPLTWLNIFAKRIVSLNVGWLVYIGLIMLVKEWRLEYP